MKKQISLIALAVLSASSLFITSCKKSSSDTPAPTPVFTNDAAFLAGTYSVYDTSITNHNAVHYTATVTTSTTVNDKFTITNFGNGGNSLVVSCTYQSSGPTVNIPGGAVLAPGRTLTTSFTNVTVTPVKFTTDYYSSTTYNQYENKATFTKN